MIEDFIGIPFVPNGRDFDGVDCYGLVKLYYKEELGILLPEYYFGDVFDCQAVTMTFESARLRDLGSIWQEVKGPGEPPTNSLIALKFNCPYVNHTGIYIGNGKFLHTRERIGSCVTRIDSPAWRRFIDSYYVYIGEFKKRGER